MVSGTSVYGNYHLAINMIIVTLARSEFRNNFPVVVFARREAAMLSFCLYPPEYNCNKLDPSMQNWRFYGRLKENGDIHILSLKLMIMTF